MHIYHGRVLGQSVYMWLLLIFLFLIPAAYTSQAQDPLLSDLRLLSQPNMTMTSPATVQRQSLGKVDFGLISHNSDTVNELVLDQINTHNTNCNVHSDGCWGFFVVRTTYKGGDDERVAAAMARLDDAVHNRILLWRQRDGETGEHEQLDDEARRRYHTVLIEDVALDGASIAQARAYFRSWAAPFIVKSDADDGEEDEDEEVRRTARFRAFILLDETVLGNLQTFPARGDLESFENLCTGVGTEWVKLVDTDNEEQEGTCGVRACDLMGVFSSLCDFDHGLESFPRDGDVPEGESEDWAFYGM